LKGEEDARIQRNGAKAQGEDLFLAPLRRSPGFQADRCSSKQPVEVSPIGDRLFSVSLPDEGWNWYSDAFARSAHAVPARASHRHPLKSLPFPATARHRPVSLAGRLRGGEERLMNRLKQLRRVATRHEKRGEQHLPIANLAAVRPW
jgi:hypothetical protein